MSRQATVFACQNCGYNSPKWLGRCPECDNFNTLVEESAFAPVARAGRWLVAPSEPISIAEVELTNEQRVLCGIGELDRVLGGGIVAGSLVLVGGEPGIGKSTLLLQSAHNLANQGRGVLMVSGEESARQIRLRAERLGTLCPSLYLLAEVDLDLIEAAVDKIKPEFVVIDSIQTVSHPDITSAPGSVAQVRECTAAFLRMAKSRGIPIFLVGHVTKDGAIAGPRVLEHMVDTVLYFEGTQNNSWRLVRAVKNRFGPTNELAIFEMGDGGLREVPSPSQFLLSSSQTGPGCIVAATMEGTRPLLMEVQALVAPSYLASPRRVTSGVDVSRLLLVAAVLERKAGARLGQQDIYLSVAGGVKVIEPALDLAMAMAMVSAMREKAGAPGSAVCGEVGLTGEVRSVGRVLERAREAARLGFERIIVPQACDIEEDSLGDLDICRVGTLQQALSHLS